MDERLWKKIVKETSSEMVGQFDPIKEMKDWKAKWKIIFNQYPHVRLVNENAIWTDGPTNQRTDQWTNRWRNPRIEMPGRIKKLSWNFASDLAQIKILSIQGKDKVSALSAFS